MLRKGRNIFLFFLLAAIQINAHTVDPVNALLKLVSRNEHKPMVVYVDAAKYPSNIKSILPKSKVITHAILKKNVLSEDIGQPDYERDAQTMEVNAKNQAKKLLFRFLRTSPDDDPNLEDTKQVLRQALRARCKKVDTCVQKCKPKKVKCIVSCQVIYDKEDFCETPKPKKPKCGKTMPPKW